MIWLFFAVQILLSVELTSKPNAYGDTAMSTLASAPIQPHVFLKEYIAQEYCESHHNFYCVKDKEFICISAGMCMTGPANASIEPILVACCLFMPLFFS